MMDPRINSRLRSVAARLRYFDLGWQITSVVALSALTAWALARLASTSGLPLGIKLAWAFVSTGAFAWIVAVGLRRYRNTTQIAGRIEKHFPNLNESLLAACSVASKKSPGYLESSVVAGVLRHDFVHRWKSVLPTGRVFVAWASLLPASVCLVATARELWRSPPNGIADLADRAPADLPLPTTVTVLPGNVEVERGSNLVFTVTFPNREPDEVVFVQLDTDAGSGNEPLSKTLMRAGMRREMTATLNKNEFGTYATSIQRPFHYAVAFDGQLTQVFDVSVFEYPSLVRADATIRQPSYTGREATETLDTRRVTVAEGAELTWRLTLNKPVEVCQLIDEEEAVIDLTPTDADALAWSSTFKLDQSRRWTVQLKDSDGRTNDEEIVLRAKVLSNDVPKIQLTSQGDAQVSPLEEFQVGAKVIDDFGIEQVGVAYQMGGGDAVEIVATDSSATSRRAEVSETIAFETLEARPRQLLSYYVWAEDRDNTGATRRTVSDIFFVEVRPFEEIFRQGRQPTAEQEQQQQQGQQQGGNQQTQELLELQKEIISATWNVIRQAKGDRLLGRTGPDVATIGESQAAAIDIVSEKQQEVTDPVTLQFLTTAKKLMGSAVEQLRTAQQSLVRSELETAFSTEQAIYQQLLSVQENESEITQSQSRSQSQSQSASQRQRQAQIDELKLDSQTNRYAEERLAQEAEDEAASEQRQTISRLRELAERQADINQQLREIEAALQLAEDEERDELEERLKRLREQQQEMLEQLDELNENLDDQQTETAEQTRSELEQVREQVQESSEALRENDTNTALSSGTRAQQKLDEIEEDVREQVSGQFTETMRQLREEAVELEKKQQEIVDSLAGQEGEKTGGLRAENSATNATDELRDQKQRLAELLEEMKQTVEDAEDAEPLLAQKLYDSYRKSVQSNLEEKIEYSADLNEQGAQKQAEQVARIAADEITELRESIEDAAEAVLGSEIEALKLASDMLQSSSEEVDAEIRANTGQAPNQQGTNQENTSEQNSNQPNSNPPSRNELSTEDRDTDSQQQAGQQQSGQSGEQEEQAQQAQQGQSGASDQQPSSEQPPSEQQSRQQGQGSQPPQDGQQTEQQQQPGRQGSEQQGSEQQRGEQQRSEQQQSGQQQSGQQQSGQQGDRRQNSQRRGGGGGWRDLLGVDELLSTDTASPIVGDDFRDWSNRLREVEELVGSPELRGEVAELRQQARELRSDLKRRSADPKWSEIEEVIAQPLRSLSRRVSDELMRRVAKKSAVVPVDRDPVPEQFRRSVETYYQNLGGGK